MILLVTDIDELKANPKRSAIGTVLEAKLDRGRGPVATVLVQDGTLRVGDNVIAGPVVGKVRALIDDRGRQRQERRPVDAGRGARPRRRCRRPATRSRRVADAGQGAADRHLPAGPGQGEGARRQGLAAHARVAAGSRSPRAASRSCRSSSRPTCRARPRCWPTRCTSCRTTRSKITIIHSGVGAINESDVLLAIGVERHRHRLQRAARPQRRRRGRAREGRHPPALGHLQRHRRDQEGHGRPARADVQGSRGSARPRCARSSRCRRSARSPAAWSPTAASRARATPRRGCCATTSWSTRASSPRCSASRTTCREVKTGFECGIGLRALQRHQGRRRHRGVPDGARRRSRVTGVSRPMALTHRVERIAAADPRRGQPDAGHRGPRPRRRAWSRSPASR